MENATTEKPAFGDYCAIEQERFGAPNEFYLYKVIGRSHSNAWVQVPVKAADNREQLHSKTEEVVSCICCGVKETEVLKFRIVDISAPEKSPWGTKAQTSNQTLVEALERIAALNDLSGVSDDEMLSAARNGLYEAETIARSALRHFA